MKHTAQGYIVAFDRSLLNLSILQNMSYAIFMTSPIYYNYVSNNNIVDVYITARILSSMNSMNSVVIHSIAQTTAKTASKIGKIFGEKGGGFSGGGLGGGGGGRW